MDTIDPYQWLILGAVIHLLGFGRWMTPVAAWLTPVLLLRFAHGMPPVEGALWIWLALGLAMAVSLRGVVPIPGVAYLALPVGWGLLGALPFMVDRLVAPLMHGFLITLVLPVSWTALEFLASRTSPYGTWGASGYTQHGNLPLMQLASVTGVWGIGFLIAWFAAVTNWAWDQSFLWSSIQSGAAIFVVVSGGVLLAGGLRLALAPEHQTVRIAGIGWPSGIVERSEFMRAVEPDVTDAELEVLRGACVRLQEAFLSRSHREAEAGSKIIVWPEANLIVLEEDEPAFLERARDLARDRSVHLLMGLVTLSPRSKHSFRNHAVLVTPNGDLAYDYTKITAVPGFEKMYGLPGSRPIPIVETEWGRIASPICYDMDFDGIIRQVGLGETDLMLVPASDWREIIPLHQPMAEFRAIENGAALFRITRWGASGAVDAYGRRLAWMDDFNTRDNVMVAHVPAQGGVRTLYARTGPAFAWACVGGLVVSLGLWVTALL